MEARSENAGPNQCAILEKISAQLYPEPLRQIRTLWFNPKSKSMQKLNLQQAGEHATLAAAAVLYFSALVLFSFWFTQS